MNLRKKIMTSFMMTMMMMMMMVALFEIGMAAEYEVGDSDGWTIGKVDYGKWAADKKFRVGDTLVFKYSTEYHNVMEVTQKDFESCSLNPIKIYNSGFDKIPLNTPGDYFFLCGFADHCSNYGQKVKISVVVSRRLPPPPPPSEFDQ